jgi:hypothetical protein
VSTWTNPNWLGEVKLPVSQKRQNRPSRNDRLRATPIRTKLPESLWQAAVDLARQHGVCPVAHPLRLDYVRLKKRLDGSQDKLAEDPFSGCVFVFRSRSGTAIQLLPYDGQGYWLAPRGSQVGRSASEPWQASAASLRNFRVETGVVFPLPIKALGALWEPTSRRPEIGVSRQRVSRAFRLTGSDGYGA